MQKKSIYKYAAEAGVPVGIYLSVMSACLLGSIKVSFLPTFLLPLAIGFPFFLWFILKAICKAEPSYQKFSSVWLCGIYTVIFGTLICMFLSSLYLTYFEPGFVNLYINNAIEVIESSPIASEHDSTVALMKEAIDAHILPSGLEFLSTIAWFTCFTGSIISLFIALILTHGSKKVARGASF